ncbi:MAG: BatD family protein [Bacteroidales bacterium]
MKKAILLIGSWLIFAVVFGQEVQNQCVTDKTKILIGEQFQLTISIQHRANQQISPFILPDTLRGFEVIRKTAAITGEQKGLKSFQQNFTLTHFDSGVYQLPALPIFYQEGEDTTKKVVYTQPITIYVNTVAVDTSKAFRPISPIQTTEYQWQEAIPYLIALAVILLIAGILYFIWWQKKRKKVIALPPPPRPLTDIVMEKFEGIEKEKRWEMLSPKLYYTELTDVLRFYLAKRYNIQTLEATTDELLAQMKDKVDKEKYFVLEGVLRTADLAKFAKLVPQESENIHNLDISRKWVEKTKDDRKLNHLGEIARVTEG